MSKETVEVRLVLVTVKRKTNTIPDTVISYEVPILQALHGKDVVKIEDLDYDTLTIQNDAQAEYERLLRKYGEKAVSVIRALYPTPNALSEATGLSMNIAALGDEGSDPAQSVQIDEGRAKRKQARAEKEPKAGKAS